MLYGLEEHRRSSSIPYRLAATLMNTKHGLKTIFGGFIAPFLNRHPRINVNFLLIFS
jgi:hypothetical protein